MPRITPITKICEICKNPFQTIRIRNRSCSKKCKVSIVRTNTINQFSSIDARKKTGLAVKIAMALPTIRKNFEKGMLNRRSYKKEKHPRWGVTLNQSTKDKISIGNKGRFKGKTWEEMYGVKKAEERRKNASKEMAKTNSKLLNDRTSKLEIIFKKYLESIGYKQNIQISKYTVDYLNENTRHIIEINGDYWHCNPKIYKKDYYNSSIGMTSEQKWKYDSERIKYLKSMGYGVKVIWESDVKNRKINYLKRLISVDPQLNA